MGLPPATGRPRRPRLPRVGVGLGDAAGFQLPEGTDCSGKIARYRAVQDNDLSMGHVVQPVYNQIKRETDAASKACTAGRDAEAKSIVAASQRRHGYPTDL